VDKRFWIVACLIVLALPFQGCGYTSDSLLPKELDSIHVDNFTNMIDPTREISDRRMNYFYIPGMETEVTRAAIDGFIFERHLKVVPEKEASMTLKGALVDIRQYPLSYSHGDSPSVEEFRLEVYVDIELYNNLTGKMMWKENRFMGWTSYAITGPNMKSQAEAQRDAVKDLSQRIVERVVENW